jgi:hypothetical protein
MRWKLGLKLKLLLAISAIVRQAKYLKKDLYPRELKFIFIKRL